LAERFPKSIKISMPAVGDPASAEGLD